MKTQRCLKDTDIFNVREISTFHFQKAIEIENLNVNSRFLDPVEWAQCPLRALPSP